MQLFEEADGFGGLELTNLKKKACPKHACAYRQLRKKTALREEPPDVFLVSGGIAAVFESHGDHVVVGQPTQRIRQPAPLGIFKLTTCVAGRI